MELREFIKQFKYLMNVEYSEYDAMNDNDTPNESLEKLIMRFANERGNNE